MMTAHEANNPDDVHANIVAIFFKTLSLVVFLAVGTYGNFGTVYSIWRDQRMQMPLNIFIATVSLADLAMCTLIMPFVAISIAYGRWIFGDIFCKIHFTFMVYLAQVTVLGVAIMLFERYRAICRRCYPSFSRRSNVCLVLIIFILPIPFSFSYYRQELAYFPSSGMCFNTHASRNYEEMCIFAVDTVLLKVIPISFDFFALWKVGALLRRLRRRVRPGTLSNEDKLTASAYAHSARTSVIFLLSYLVLDLPLYVALVVHRHSVFQGHAGISGNARATCLWLFWMECAIKPMIYALRKQRRADRIQDARRLKKEQDERGAAEAENGREGRVQTDIPKPPTHAIMPPSYPMIRAFGDLSVLSTDDDQEAVDGNTTNVAQGGISTAESKHKLTTALVRSLAYRYQASQGCDEAGSEEPNPNRRTSEEPNRNERLNEEPNSNRRNTIDLGMIELGENRKCCSVHAKDTEDAETEV